MTWNNKIQKGKISAGTIVLLLSLYFHQPVLSQSKIDRKVVVNRHDIVLHAADTLSSVTLGNGAFAFTVDVTGLQTFCKDYQNGVPLGTESEWGWHSFPNIQDDKIEETYKYYDLYGRKNIPYCVQPKKNERAKEAVEYFRVNPHRLQLGNIGFIFLKRNGDTAALNDIQHINQHLDVYKGILESDFTIDNESVKVFTCADQQADGIAFKVSSRLIKEHRLFIRVAFPYPTGTFKDAGTNYTNASSHQSFFVKEDLYSGYFEHRLDTTAYFLSANWNEKVKIDSCAKHIFIIRPETNRDEAFVFNAIFSPHKVFMNDYLDNVDKDDLYHQVEKNGEAAWERYWQSGGAVDFAGSSDKRAFELERRIILSEYLERAECAGHMPPQETGLTYNSWYGKPHLEMYWWHAAHFALWGRPELLEKSIDWYIKVAGKAKAIAQRQGFDGIRWQKMTDPQGDESPSSVGAFLIWQQPHFIYLAELLYRTERQKQAVLDKYKALVYKTADFIASFPVYDPLTHKYNLGKGLIPAQECFNPVQTYNPTYELAYWSWALKTAQEWRLRDGLPRNKNWDRILHNLAPLPKENGLYMAAQNATGCYDTASRYTHDHPAVLAALATIPPSNGLDTAVMHRTFDEVHQVWHWPDTWGWDFPLMAMTATRLHLPGDAVDALLMKAQKNTYLPNGNNYQDDRLTIYLPGNGGLLSAVALMCAGFDGNKVNTPGFDPSVWKVRWEGLQPMP